MIYSPQPFPKIAFVKLSYMQRTVVLKSTFMQNFYEKRIFFNFTKKIYVCQKNNSLP